jgi:DNA-binding HxlR family transcriptional regulator
MEIMDGRDRSGRLLRALPGISPGTLSLRLSELEWVGVIAKIGSDQSRVTYLFTNKGKDLRKLIDSMATLSIKWHRPV